MAKKPGFTIEQHREIGQEVKAVYKNLLEVGKEVSNHYPNTGRSAKALTMISKMTDLCIKLKCEMEEILKEEHPQLELEEYRKFYYGRDRSDHS